MQRGDSPAALAQNIVCVRLADEAGEAVGSVEAEDVSVCVEGGVGPGEVEMGYSVDASRTGPVIVQLCVMGQPWPRSPWTVVSQGCAVRCVLASVSMVSEKLPPLPNSTRACCVIVSWWPSCPVPLPLTLRPSWPRGCLGSHTHCCTVAVVMA